MQDLPPAPTNDRREVDLTVVATRMVSAPDGTVIVRKGQTIDPLDHRPFTLRLVVFDATRPREVRFARRQSRGHGNVMLIATRLDRDAGWDGLKSLDEELDGAVYLLTPELRRRFDLRYTPAVVRQSGRRILVEEFHLAGGPASY